MQYAKLVDKNSLDYAPINKNGISNYNINTEKLIEDGYLQVIKTEAPAPDYVDHYEIIDNCIVQVWEKISEVKLSYSEKRLREYPSVSDMIDAICKKLDGNSSEYNELEEQRLMIKARYPKEEQ